MDDVFLVGWHWVIALIVIGTIGVVVSAVFRKRTETDERRWFRRGAGAGLAIVLSGTGLLFAICVE